jgi:hypothetical protein
VSFAHPRTVGLTDPQLPVLPSLLGEPVPEPLRAVTELVDGEIVDSRVVGVTWWPGKSITVRYAVEVAGGQMAGRHTLVAVAGRIPQGAIRVERDGWEVGVWRVPHDPALPGLAPALDNRLVRQMLVDLGAPEGDVVTRLRAYRPTRRAVVEAKGAHHDVFLKVIRPRKVETLHRIHRSLADHVAIPASLGVDPALGILALQALEGATLRQVMEDPSQELPPAVEIVGMSRLPDPDPAWVAPSPVERLGSMAGLIAAITPELAPRVADLVGRVGEERDPADHPVHGDFYEAQLMVRAGRVAGLLDVDTYGWGRPTDDAATMLGHLSVWATLSAEPDRVGRLGGELLGLWDRQLDPIDLRLRAAAVVISLAAGPFRVQSAAWPSETADRLAIAERWLESASRVGEGPPF